MRIQGKKLKKQAELRGVSVEQLAQALVTQTFKLPRAESAVRNWMAGRDHPRCKAAFLEKMARVLGCEPKDIAAFTCEVRYHRGSPRKAGLIAGLIRGKPVEKALNLLTFTTKRAAVNFKKALNSAITDAERAQADVTRLVVTESRVNQAPRIKRSSPRTAAAPTRSSSR